MKKIAFLILHYLSIEDTLLCVDSIKKVDYNNYKIFIVDNGSSNNTGKELQKKFSRDKLVDVIISEKNLGFANGNNLGFKYIKDNYSPDFIVMINNDIILNQNDFCSKIVDEYNYSNFDVLGPKIFLPGNKINTYAEELLTLKEYKEILRKKKMFYFFNKIHLRYIYSFFDKLFNNGDSRKIIDKSKRKENVILNGCCLIFSKNYIDRFDGIDNRTFLYYEEPLLFIRLIRNNMKSVYNPRLTIFHNESSSTNKKTKNKWNRFDFVLKNEIKSLEVLISELEQEKR